MEFESGGESGGVLKVLGVILIILLLLGLVGGGGYFIYKHFEKEQTKNLAELQTENQVIFLHNAETDEYGYLTWQQLCTGGNG